MEGRNGVYGSVFRPPAPRRYTPRECPLSIARAVSPNTAGVSPSSRGWWRSSPPGSSTWLPVDVDAEIEDALRRVCEPLGIDLAVLWLWTSVNPGVISATHFYADEGLRPPGGTAPGAFPLVPRADAGRPGGRRFFAGGVPGGGCRRPGVLPYPRRQVQSVPPALGGGRAPRRRPGFQHPAGGARLAGHAPEAPAGWSRRSSPMRWLGSARTTPCARARSACRWPRTPRRRGSGPSNTAPASSGSPRRPGRSSGTRRTRRSPGSASGRGSTPTTGASWRERSSAPRPRASPSTSSTASYRPAPAARGGSTPAGDPFAGPPAGSCASPESRSTSPSASAPSRSRASVWSSRP